MVGATHQPHSSGCLFRWQWHQAKSVVVIVNHSQLTDLWRPIHPPSRWEVHLWSEHLVVMGRKPFCGSGMSQHLFSHLENAPPPTDMHIWQVAWMSQHLCHTWRTWPPPPHGQETRGGGLRTAVALALLLVFLVSPWRESCVNFTSEASEKAKLWTQFRNFQKC